MPYTKDTNIVSVLWGRIGAAILIAASLILGSLGYTFAEEQQQAAFEIVSGLLAGFAGLQVIISKVRETKKIKE